MGTYEDDTLVYIHITYVHTSYLAVDGSTLARSLIAVAQIDSLDGDVRERSGALKHRRRAKASPQGAAVLFLSTTGRQI